MALTYYSLVKLKELAMDSANTIGLPTQYREDDVDKAYGYACGRCGYTNPDASDADYGFKQTWLIEMMQVYFLRDVQNKYLLKFDVGDLKLGQVSRMVRDMLSDREAGFEKAKSDPNTAHLFVNAATYFGKSVFKSGIVDDMFGHSLDEAELE